MLRSTYRAAQQPAESPLPPGWTEHKAPTGHIYYYNAETKRSTYTRPQEPSDEPLQIDYGATQPDLVVRASINALDQFNQTNNQIDPRGQGHFTGGRSYQDRPQQHRRHGHQGDRPKSKAAIPNCAPWVLVKTKMGRRFVHNTETKQSLWKFPSEVMMAVIDMDRMEWEAKKKAESQTEQGKNEEQTDLGNVAEKPEQQTQAQEDYDSDSYEEVEVTDDEDEAPDGTQDQASKRPRVSKDQPDQDTAPSGPLEFNEDDIAWQLAQMEQDEMEMDYNDDDVENLDGDAENQTDQDDEGLPLTDNDAVALYRSLLDDSHISPFSTFEKLIEDMNVIEDPRYSALPTTTRRREEFTSWSRDRIAEQKALQEQQSSIAAGENGTSKKPQPTARSEYLSFLHENATPKLYWPEFKRKYRKHDSMMVNDKSLPEKDKEKLYREYISKITKVSEQERRKTFLAMLKDLTKEGKLDEARKQFDKEEGRGTMGGLYWPNEVTGDIRWILVAKGKRTDLVNEFFRTF